MNIYYCSNSFFAKKMGTNVFQFGIPPFENFLKNLVKIYFVYPKMMLHNCSHVARQPGITFGNQSPGKPNLFVLDRLFYTGRQNVWSVCSRGQEWGMEDWLPIPPAFQYLILMTWRAGDLDLVMVSSLASKWQGLKFGMPVFQLFYKMKLKTSLGILRPVKISWRNSNHKLFMSLIKNWKKLVGVATLLSSILPSGT